MSDASTAAATADLPLLMRPTLKRIADEDPDLLMRDVARGLLDGSVPPRQVWSHGPYAEMLSARAERFATLYQELTSDERALLSQAGQRELEGRRAALDRP